MPQCCKYDFLSLIQIFVIRLIKTILTIMQNYQGELKYVWAGDCVVILTVLIKLTTKQQVCKSTNNHLNTNFALLLKRQKQLAVKGNRYLNISSLAD